MRQRPIEVRRVAVHRTARRRHGYDRENSTRSRMREDDRFTTYHGSWRVLEALLEGKLANMDVRLLPNIHITLHGDDASLFQVGTKGGHPGAIATEVVVVLYNRGYYRSNGRRRAHETIETDLLNHWLVISMAGTTRCKSNRARISAAPTLDMGGEMSSDLEEMHLRLAATGRGNMEF